MIPIEAAYREHRRLLYTVAYNVLGSAAEAEDCVHDALLRVWNNADAYDAARGNVRSFLVVCVRNDAISRVRKRAARAAIDVRLAAEPSYEMNEFPDAIERGRLAAAIKMLPPEQWEPLRLAYFEYLTHVQIAQRLGIPLGTIKSRISLGLRKLAMQLRESNS